MPATSEKGDINGHRMTTITGLKLCTLAKMYIICHRMTIPGHNGSQTSRKHILCRTDYILCWSCYGHEGQITQGQYKHQYFMASYQYFLAVGRIKQG
jgi:hypothetical protein